MMHAAVEGAFLCVMLGFVAFGLLCSGIERARRALEGSRE
jgi:hypothetical protein